MYWKLQSLVNLKHIQLITTLGAGGEGDDRGWDGWMASLTRWTWVSVNSGSWWWTGKPGVLQFMGSQRAGHDWATDLIWSDIYLIVLSSLDSRRSHHSILREISHEYSSEGLMLKLKLQYFGHLMRRATHWQRPWCWERFKAKAEGDDRGWHG